MIAKFGIPVLALSAMLSLAPKPAAARSGWVYGYGPGLPYPYYAPYSDPYYSPYYFSPGYGYGYGYGYPGWYYVPHHHHHHW